MDKLSLWTWYWLNFFTWRTMNCYTAEQFIGTITPMDNRTFVLHMGGTTVANYTLVTWQYTVQTSLTRNTNTTPVLYFRHRGQETGYGTEAECFRRDFDKGYGMDPRLVPMTEFKRQQGRDKECTVVNEKVTCTGSLDVATAHPRQWFVSIGFRCGFESALDVSYNITVIPIREDNVPCTDWSKALNELQEPIEKGAQDWITYCSHFYPQFSKWNIFGLTQHDFGNKVYWLSKIASNLKCHKYFDEISCRTFVPECYNGRVKLICDNTCKELLDSCGTKFLTAINFNFSCTSITATANDHINRECVHKPVTCDVAPSLPCCARSESNGTSLGSIMNVTCSPFYRRNGQGVLICRHDGEWHWLIPISCDISCHFVALITTSITVLIGYLTNHYRFEIKLLAFTYSPTLVKIYRFIHRHDLNPTKEYHAFLVYQTKQKNFAKKKIYHPLKNLGYKIGIDDVTFLPGDDMIDKIPEVISKSHRLIVVLNQEFLNSWWCQYELKQAKMHEIEDSSFRFIVVLSDDPKRLKNVPRWLEAFLRTNIYIRSDDPKILQRLRSVLPDQNAILAQQDLE